MDNRDPDYRQIIDRLRDGGHFNTPPPSTPDSEGGRIPPMQDLEPRVSRLETGLVAGGLALLGTIASAYFLTANKIEKVSDKLGETTVSIAELKGAVKLLEDRSIESNKRLERIEAKLDTLIEKR